MCVCVLLIKFYLGLDFFFSFLLWLILWWEREEGGREREREGGREGERERRREGVEREGGVSI